MDLYSRIDAHQDDLIGSLQGCVRIPSIYAQDQSGWPYGEPVHNCLHYMLDLCRSLGFTAEHMDERVGWCEYGQGDEMVGVLCHLDVVPEGEGWTVPPYGGTVKDGRIYSRGTMDDKGPALAALYALLAVKESGLPLRRRIRILFGLNEETGCDDMAYYLAHGGEVPVLGITPDGMYPVINGEKGLVIESYARPLHQTGKIRLTSLTGGTAVNIVPARASARLSCPPESAAQIAALSAGKICVTPTDGGVQIDAQGVEAHGGSPEEGENAIGRLMLFLEKLPLEGELKEAVSFFARKFAMEWDGKSLGIAASDELSGPLTMNLGVIHGDAESIRTEVNYRYPVTGRFEDCGPAVRAAFEEAGFACTGLQHMPALYMPPESPLVQTLLSAYQSYTGQSAAPLSIGGGTYAKSMPNTLAFGPIFPGDEAREHKPDEYMEIGRLMDNAKLLSDVMLRLAGE